jgi:AraC family transcriptional regulator of adaptative response / DNA-3-methyladenine glycosylase II
VEPFTAVITTGIYCRPGCKGNPLARNTKPYTYAAAAEAAGFRPCLRCRPDRVPVPGWIDAPELVCRAMRAIADGVLDQANEDELAEQLGVSARHLRRLFEQHIGATPSEVARSKRAHFARRLLDDTDLTMTEISAAAGFNSVRQMNRVMKDVFKFTPQELRARRLARDRLVTDGGLELRIPYRPPLAWDAMLQFLAPRAVPGVEAIDLETGTYRRTVRQSGEPAVVEVWNEPDRGALRLRAHLPDYSGLVHLVGGVRRLFDLDADPDVIDAALARDKVLRPLVRARRGLRVPGTMDRFELGVRAVLGQQVSVAGATTLAGRLVEKYGRPVPGLAPLGLTHLFPAARTIACVDIREIGLPAARADAIQAFAAATTADRLPAESDGLESTVAGLCELAGFGPWTANYIAMRAYGQRDAFPASDLGLRKALNTENAKATEARVATFSPWRAYAAMHLWCTHGAEGAFSQVRRPISARQKSQNPLRSETGSVRV